MLNVDYELLLNIAQKYNLPDVVEEITAVKELDIQHNCFISFIGQFSSGKSSLINNILNRKLLPQGITETTPLLTYISYGVDEKAVVHYLDGNEKTVQIEEISKLRQNAKNDDLDKIERLEIFLNDPLLANGIVLMDTPGINTLIDKHEYLLDNTLRLSSKIFYVTSHAPNEFDADKLEMLIKQGFNISYVRTHFDNIKASEEDVITVIDDDKEFLATFDINAEEYFPVSNLAESEFYKGVSSVQSKLQNIAKNSDELLRTKILSVVERIVQILKDNVVSEKTALEAQKSSNVEYIENEKNKLNNDINALNNLMENISENTEKDIKKALDDFHKVLLKVEDEIVTKHKKSIINAEFSGNYEEAMRAELKRETAVAVEEMLNRLNVALNPLLENINGRIRKEDFEIILPEDVPHIINAAVIAAEEDNELIDLRFKLKEIKTKQNELQQVIENMQGGTEYEELTKALQAAREEILKSKNELAELGIYVPKYLEEEEGMQPSQILKGIGKIADLAMMVVPIPTPAKATALKYGAKAIGMAEKAAKIAKSGKNLKDTAAALKTINRVYATKRRIKQATDIANTVRNGINVFKTEEPSVLDYLTVEYWAETIGKNFDTPPKKHIDLEYERAFKAEESKIRKALKDKQKQEFDIQTKIKKFNTEAERMAALRKALIVDESKIQQQLEAKKKGIEKNAKKLAISNWKCECADILAERLKNVFSQVEARYTKDLPARALAYQNKKIEKIKSKLEDKLAAIEKLKCLSFDDIEDKIAKCDKNLNLLELQLKK